MAVSVPYLASPNSIKNALDKIAVAATPERVTGDFVSTKMQMKGGTGAAILPYLKKIGFVASDGSPTSLYRRFRNQATSGAAVADAIKHGYSPLADANEYFYELDDKGLKSLLMQVTGAAADSQVVKFTVATLNALKSYANFDEAETVDEVAVVAQRSEQPSSTYAIPLPERSRSEPLGLNLSYTINLNLPATSDQAVFNAIFRSLKEHLLSGNE